LRASGAKMHGIFEPVCAAGIQDKTICHAELKDELLQYLYYYNQGRSHQGIHGIKSIEVIKTLPN